MSKASKSALEMFLSGVMGLGFVFGFFNNILPSYIAMLFAGLTIVGALLFTLAMVKDRQSPTKILFFITFAGGGAFFLMFGIMWYFTVYIPSNPASFQINFPSATSVPKGK